MKSPPAHLPDRTCTINEFMKSLRSLGNHAVFSKELSLGRVLGTALELPETVPDRIGPRVQILLGGVSQAKVRSSLKIIQGKGGSQRQVLKNMYIYIYMHITMYIYIYIDMYIRRPLQSVERVRLQLLASPGGQAAIGNIDQY